MFCILPKSQPCCWTLVENVVIIILSTTIKYYWNFVRKIWTYWFSLQSIVYWIHFAVFILKKHYLFDLREISVKISVDTAWSGILMRDQRYFLPTDLLLLQAEHQTFDADIWWLKITMAEMAKWFKCYEK